MKKIGYFFAGFLPVLLSLSFQFLATFFLIGMGAVVLALSSSGFMSAYDLLENLLTLMTDTQFEMGIMVLFAAMNIAVFGLWYKKKLGGNFRPDARRTFDVVQIVGIIVLVPGAQFFCSFFIMLISSIFPSWLEQYERLMETAGMDGSSVSLLLILYSVILGPIGEELLFRGVTMRLAGKVFPFWIANIFQAVLFGVFHMNLLQGSYAFVLGLLLGFICEGGGSIYCSMIFHMLFNLWGTFSGFMDNIKNPVVEMLVMLVVMIVSLGAGLTLFNVGNRRVRRKNMAGAFAPESKMNADQS